MPRLTRRIAVRAGLAGLATGGTLVGVLAARKLTTTAPPVAGPPPLQTLAGLRPVSPPAKLPPYRWQVAHSDGSIGPSSIADHAGHGVLLNLWATWCDPCVREMPSLARLAVLLASAEIVVLPVSIDRGGAGSVRAFYRAHAIEGLPILLDPESTAMTALTVGGIPTSFLIDAAGAVRARFEGAADWSKPEALASVQRLIGR